MFLAVGKFRTAAHGNDGQPCATIEGQHDENTPNLAAGRGAGAVRPDGRADARAAAHLRADARADVDEAADDRVTYKDADGTDIVPDVAAHARTDDHART